MVFKIKYYNILCELASIYISNFISRFDFSLYLIMQDSDIS